MSTFYALAPAIAAGSYLLGAVLMAVYLYLATDRGRALVGSPAATLGACLLWILAWPVFVVLLVAAEVALRAPRRGR